MGIGLVDTILKPIADELDASPSEVSLLFTSYLAIMGVFWYDFATSMMSRPSVSSAASSDSRVFCARTWIRCPVGDLSFTPVPSSPSSTSRYLGHVKK